MRETWTHPNSSLCQFIAIIELVAPLTEYRMKSYLTGAVDCKVITSITLAAFFVQLS